MEKIKTIKQLFRRYGFYETGEGFMYCNKNRDKILITIPKHLREKNIRMINRYLKEEKMIMKAIKRIVLGKNKWCWQERDVPYIGFEQTIQGFRAKKYQEFAPSEFHCKEVQQLAETPLYRMF